jgi:hypothetical protein
MTNTGSLTSVDRHGINKLDTDPLSRASFEQTVEQLLNAAVFGEVDSMNSVSSKIMVGQVIRGGTGMCDLLIDTNIFENSEYLEEYDKPYISTFKCQLFFCHNLFSSKHIEQLVVLNDFLTSGIIL